VTEQAPPSVSRYAGPDETPAVREEQFTLTGSLIVRTRVSAGYIWLLILATLGSYAALVAPIGISLSLRVQELAAGNEEVLGYVVGAGAIVAAVSSPIMGMWSDRTRSRCRHRGRTRSSARSR